MAARAKASRWRLIRDTRGVTVVEYALIGSLIFIVIVVAVTSLGSNVQNAFGVFANSL